MGLWGLIGAGFCLLSVILLLRELRKTNPTVEKSMFAAIHDAQIDTFAGCKFRGQSHPLVEYYDLLAGPMEARTGEPPAVEEIT